MPINHLLAVVARQSTVRRTFATQPFLRQTLRAASTAPATATESPAPSPPPPDFMIYDRLAEVVKSKLAQLENPDPRFLRHGSPHPAVADHSRVLAAPETKVTMLPTSLRVATESNLAAKTAMVRV